ncbi:TPA: HIT family protein [Candidatus Woesearchaeota archaeon]|nr:HIT family protein [Candidatus Woesearchaeota archaeon]HII88936.1 HIT family protein [Candidatus Woesearchaeota archaeon]
MQLSPEQQKMLEEQKANCPFCKIIAGEIPARKVYENEQFLIVLDINPATKGHMLVVPKEHYPILPFIPMDAQKKLFVMLRDVMGLAQHAMVTRGSTLFIANGQAAGQNVNHFMVHVIPRDKNDGLYELHPKQEDLASDAEEFKKLGGTLKNTIRTVIQRATGKAPPGGQPQLTQPTQSREVSEDELINVIEINKPLLDLVLQQPEAFKKVALQHPQLKDLFKGKDVGKIVDKVLEKHGKTKQKEGGKKEEKQEKKQKKDGKENKEKEVEAEFEDVKDALGGDKEEKEPKEGEEKEEQKKEESLDDIAKLFG